MRSHGSGAMLGTWLATRMAPMVASYIGPWHHRRHARRRKENGLQHDCCNPLILLAEWTGLEPATPGVTGRYSNQLNYHS